MNESNNTREAILIVEDDARFASVLSSGLEQKYNVDTTSSLAAARDALNRNVYHGVLLDLRLRGENSHDTDGLTLLTEIKEDRPLMPVVLMTAYADTEIAVEAMKIGADEFIDKTKVDPANLIRVFQNCIRNSLDQLHARAALDEQLLHEPSNLVGDTQVMREVSSNVDLAAQDGFCSVLILGETGTGKEVVARAIHGQGWRRNGPFVPVATPALSPQLIESELFGHEKGAFTGATERREGFIEKAHGGVLFLDEIGDLPTNLQTKLLRFLEDRIVQRVGGTKPIPVDVQLVAATNRDLDAQIREGQFREDLYYRLNTVTISVPPLHGRKEDIPMLADHFLSLFRKQGRTKLVGFQRATIEAMQAHAFPGNVRELKNIVERALLTASQSRHVSIEFDDLPQDVRNASEEIVDSQPQPANLVESEESLNVEVAMVHSELSCIDRALHATKGNKTKAEKLLGYPNRQTMRRRIQRLRDEHPDIWTHYPSVLLYYGDTHDADK